MSTRYVRTPAGQAEIQGRTHQLSRAVRNLLLVINDSRTIEDWLSHLHGVTADDVTMLISAGLIAQTGAAAPEKAVARPADLRAGVPKPTASPATAAAVAPATGGVAVAGADAAENSDWVRTQQVIRNAPYNALYDALNSIGKAKLGLVRGYRFALEVEKCNGVDEIRVLAMKFAEQLRSEHGMAAVGELTYAIGAVKA